MNLKEFTDANKDHLVELACRLIAAHTENPPGNEHLAAAIMRAELEPLGIPCTAYEKEPGRTNLVGRIGSGSPRILIACHFDVVPAGVGWDTDPYKAVVRDGRIYGRGSSDNKGQLAAMIVAGKFLKQHEDRLIGEVLLVGAADEERGSGLGLEWLADEGVLQADFAIIPDVAHQLKEISIGEKGAFFIKVVSHGRQAHGSNPSLGLNAITPMLDFLEEVRQLDLGTAPDPLFSPPTCNIGVINGGSAANIVPARCEAQIDFRFLPSQRGTSIKEKLQEIAARIEKESPGAKFTFEDIMMVDPFRIDSDHPLLVRLCSSARKVLGIEPAYIGMSGSTVAKPLVRTGTPAVGFDPAESSQAHVANESIAIEDLLRFIELLGTFLLEEAK